jgi:uncharacterized radical SAM superfamily Fe-S cluster-containing enzyme
METRTDKILRYVNAFCPTCHEENPNRSLHEVERLSGYLSIAEGNVWLVRGCRIHGKIVTLYDERPDILEYLEQWTAPTKYHIPDTADNFDPIPAAYLQGLGEMQTQHTCILLEEITQECNLRCPVCFADSSPQLSGVASVADILANVDQRLAREGGRIDVLMLSGGEPTIHPEFSVLLDEVVARPITRIIVNSNGVKIARDDELLETLRSHNERVEVYLQFDGFRSSTYLHHRNADLSVTKKRAVARLSHAGVFTTLTMTATLGVNDDEIGDVVEYALDTPFIGGVSIQPQFGSGRGQEINALDRLTHTGVLARLGPQTQDRVTWHDLTALPCSHPHCCSVGYMLMDDAGSWQSLVSLVGHEQLLGHLDLVANRIADHQLPDEVRSALKASLLGLMSEQSSLSHPSIGELITNVCESCDLGLSTLLRAAAGSSGDREQMRKILATRVKRITVKPFMDMNTMIEERLIQCCVHVGTRSEDLLDQCAPFCAVQAWAPLGRQKLSEVAGANVGSVPISLQINQETQG